MQIGNRRIDTVAVVGAGFIGMGWTIVFARAGLATRVYDADPEQLTRLADRLAPALRDIQRAGWLSEGEIEALREHVTYATGIRQALAGADYIQEAVPENLVAKRAVFTELDSLAPADVVLGSSTSGLSMTEIADQTSHPERCVVVHPTNPPHIVPLVEIVPGERTAPETVDLAQDLMEAVGQTPIVCRKEVPGFVLNRLQFALEREAFYLAREGVASVADIDRAVSEGLGLRWALLGPFLVEETNADNVRDDLTKFSAAIRDLLEQVCRPFDGLEADDIDRVVAGVGELMGLRAHDDLLSFRDVLVLRIRRLKENWHPGQT